MTKQEREKLEHAVNRSANKAYCGSKTDPDLLALVRMGYMRGPIEVGFLPETEAYFQATPSGVARLSRD